MIGILDRALGSRIDHWNKKLTRHSKAFRKRYPNTSIAIYNAHGIFTDILDNPKSYGFADATTICYEGCIWHDHIHPTAKVQELLTKGLLDLLIEN